MWQTEVNYLGQLRHENLVKLIGYCSESDNRLLVYEFMPKGSLENHLFRSKNFFLCGLTFFFLNFRTDIVKNYFPCPCTKNRVQPILYRMSIVIDTFLLSTE